ncbi:MAG: hypothetical protein SFW36_18135 [Leptolyngbyaceae cyanobacterium bins.59]|nr:hypothetical protein [Leptolyngbyaceae cyanobacterium bins.59]
MNTDRSRPSPNSVTPEPSGMVSADDLLSRLLTASSLEQSGQINEAVSLYQDIIALDPEGTYGKSAERALAAIPSIPRPSVSLSPSLPVPPSPLPGPPGPPPLSGLI